MANLTKNSAGDNAGHYYTGTAEDLGSVTVPAGIGNSGYLCPGSPAPGNATPNFGPFKGAGYSAANLGPVGSNKVWTPFAAWNQQQTVLPLPHTIQANPNGFQFSNPPVFNSGNNYTAQLPNDNTQPPAQYYGNSQSDFIVAPSNSGTQPPSTPFPLPTDPANASTPFTELEGFSDWAATVSLANAAQESMQLTFANGSPLAFLEFNTEFAWLQPSTAAPLAFLSPYNLPQVVLPPQTPGCPGTSPCVVFGGGPPTYAVGESYPITWLSLGVGNSALLDLYFITPNSQTLIASAIPNDGLYTWKPDASQVTGQNTFTGRFWLAQTGQVPPAVTGANAQSINFAVVSSTSELPSNQPSLANAQQPPANTLFGAQYLNDAQIPLASWFPQGYAVQTPASAQILVGGPAAISIFNELSVTFGGQTASYTTQAGDTNESAAHKLQLACQQTFTTLNVSAVQASGQNHFFLLSNQSGAPLTTGSVTVSPTAGSPTIQTVLIASNQASSINNPPGEIVGLTITGVAAATSASGSYYQSSYLLIAPPGSQWTFQSGGANLVCQFPAATPPAAQGGTIIIVAMPQISAEAYADYNTPATGAAALLQSYWSVMSPFAYGCPRHLDNNNQDDGTGTQFGPNKGQQFTPQVTTANGKTTVTTTFACNLTYPLGQPDGAKGTLFGLFPHQWRAYARNTATLLNAGANDLAYQTVAGMLKLCGGEEFSTTYDFPGLLAALPNVAALNGKEAFKVYDYPSQTAQTVNAMTLSDQLTQDASMPVWSANNFGANTPGGGSTSAQNAFIPAPPSFQQKWGVDSYDWGKIVGGIGDLIQPAFLLGNNGAGQAAISQLNAQLGQWLSGALIYADDLTPFPPGVLTWQTAQGNTSLAGSTGLNSGQQFLYYDSQWATFIPYPTAYYADTNINDHHFHYGYWLRAAAQLALAQALSQDPNNAAGTFISNYGATINLIIKDIANPLRGDQGAAGASALSFPGGPATPFLRYFDGYFGHSWASGLALNILNQESLSEAMSAWTGVIMWGELTGDTSMRDLGIWMYTQEMFSFYEYWMDCAQNAASGSALFPAGSPANIVGDAYAQSINGGAATATLGFCTQVYNSYLELTSDFGMDPLYLTGIQWLPFHGGSLYLSSTDAAVNSTLQAVFNWAQSNSQSQWGPTNNGATLPFYQPTPFAVTWEPVAWNHAATIGIDTADHLWSGLEQAVGSSGTATVGDGWKPLGGEAISYSYYWIYNICALGSRDATVSADYPFAVKFINGATSTSYVVSNLTSAPLTVNFSDGKVVSKVAPYNTEVVSGD
ncbi:MAG TPA: glycosyl hydrolase [Pyrinomonadaceae bacterium]